MSSSKSRKTIGSEPFSPSGSFFWSRDRLQHWCSQRMTTCAALQRLKSFPCIGIFDAIIVTCDSTWTLGICYHRICFFSVRVSFHSVPAHSQLRIRLVPSSFWSYRNDFVLFRMATLESNHEILLRLIGQIVYFRQVYIRRWGIFCLWLWKIVEWL